MHAMKCLPFLFLFLLKAASDDYYDLLGINKDAGDRDIRRAFKKLALKLHPDKNQDDPHAHENFLKINRAYEVLKDEELRKKYDTYGEEGLKEDHFGGHYKSWQFYNQEFGIYDEDPEIITLSRSDFEQSVINSGDLWFVNFYSPNCHHCHNLAPTWREVGRELQGVVRIGAVNCGEDWGLCNQQGIHSFPSLLIFPRGQKYQGDRSKKALVKHALQFVSATVHELNERNIDQKMTGNTRWLLHFCSADGDCLSSMNRIKLAASLDKIYNVGVIDCTYQSTLCQRLGYTTGTVPYKPDSKEFLDPLVTSLDALELSREAIELLPFPDSLTSSLWAEVENDVSHGHPWLVLFSDISSELGFEMKKLPLLLIDIKVGQVDCRQEHQLCQNVHMKDGQVALFKQVGYEQHHGRMVAQDIASFARESSLSHVRSLTPNDFPDRVINSGEPWFVDFFAPWCPPCMRLLPEWRKAATNIGQSVSFGTVDCTVHGNLCSQMHIRSYPTTIFYNQSVPHQFHGDRTAHGLVEFVQDTLNPKVITLTDKNFDDLVRKRGKKEVWMVDFYAPWCGPCNQLMPTWNKVGKVLQKKANVGKVDCTTEHEVCNREGVQSYPTIRLYPAGQSGSRHYETFKGWRNAQSIRAWAFQYLPSKVSVLNDNNFHSSVLQSQDPWLVDFYAPWCGHCMNFAPNFERVAELLEHKVKCGKVDCQSHPSVCQRFGIRQYPTVHFYEGSDGGSSQSSASLKISSQNVNEIINIVNKELRKKQKQHDEL